MRRVPPYRFRKHRDLSIGWIRQFIESIWSPEIEEVMRYLEDH